MRFLLAIKKHALLAFVVFAHLSLKAAEVRLSFFMDIQSLNDTIKILAENNCSKTGTMAFRKAVQRYYEEPFGFDFKNFPEPVQGFYVFPSPKALIKALPHRLAQTQHSSGINCIDTAVLLSWGNLHTRLRPDEYCEPFLLSIGTTNGLSIGSAATPRAAFVMSWPSGYRNLTDMFIPASMQDDRVCLSVSLFRWRRLPISASMEKLAPQVLEVLQEGWKREKVEFPTEFEIVSLHEVDFSGRLICTCHHGLLFRRKAGYMYIEKSGLCGPFVRLDVANKSDLLEWSATAFEDYSDPNFPRFATFNNTTIEKIGPK